MSESKSHKGTCCMYLDRKDGKYKCAIKGCNKVLEKKPDE